MFPSNANVDIFTGSNAASTVALSHVTWQKPSNKTMGFFMALGGGGGGGGGFSRVTAGNPGGGGAAGTGGTLSTLLIPLILLPDCLELYIGKGGPGRLPGEGQTPVHNPGQTYILADTETILLGNIGNLGGLGANTGTTNAPTATSAVTVSGNPAVTLGVYSFTSGGASSGGGSQTGGAGQALAIPTNGVRVMGGTGGGGSQSADFAGGSITAVANDPLSDVRPINAPAGSNNGSDGYTIWKPFFSFGGMGGGSSNTGNGGNGGNGGYGAGGGGGGAGIVGGRGGDGGPGLVIIATW